MARVKACIKAPASLDVGAVAFLNPIDMVEYLMSIVAKLFSALLHLLQHSITSVIIAFFAIYAAMQEFDSLWGDFFNAESVGVSHAVVFLAVGSLINGIRDLRDALGYVADLLER